MKRLQKTEHLGKSLMISALAVVMSGALSVAQAQTARVYLDGQPLVTAVPPIVQNGRTLVPMRDIFESLGATVVWNPNSQEITAQKADKRIWLQIGNRTARVNQDQVWLTEAPRIYNRSTLVPLRFVSEALGASVNWDGTARLVSITSADRMASGAGGTMSSNTPPYNAPPYTTPTAAQRDTLTIPAGAVVPVTLDKEISSATARVGDTFGVTVKSEKVGDSEFPPGTRLRGRVTEVQRKADGTPGVLGLEFISAILPSGENVNLKGELISLDDDSVNQVSTGRIMAKKGSDNGSVKAIGVGAAAGFVLGKVLGKSSLVTAILGAAGGYLYDRSKDKGKEQEAVIDEGSTLGVRLTNNVSYTDTSGYANERVPYLG